MRLRVSSVWASIERKTCIIHFRYPALVTLLFLLLSSCSSQEEPAHEVELLSKIWHDMTRRNTWAVEYIGYLVEEKGRRKQDVMVFEKTKALFEARENFELTLSPDPELLSQGFGRLPEYVTYLELTKNDHEYNYTKDWESHVEAIEYFHSKIQEEFDLKSALNISVHLAHLERDLLGYFAEEVGASSCTFGINFVFTPNNQNIKVGEVYELIVSPAEMDSFPGGKYDYHTASLKLENILVDDFEFRTIGRAAYLKFTPKSSGKYFLNTSFKAVFNSTDHVYEQPVVWMFTVQDE